MSCLISVPVYFGILTIFLIEMVSLQTLNEITARNTACFGTGDHSLVNANCSSTENIYPIQLQVGAKPSASGCPLEMASNETDTVIQQCCLPATNQDCIASYSTYAPSIASSYLETCVGRTACSTRQAARVDVLSITSCNATGYPGQTHYMYLDYYCVPDSKIGRFPSVDMTNDGAGSILYLQGSNYPFMTSVTSMTCSVETDCFEAISIYGLHVDFQLDNVTCNQALVLNDTFGTLTTIGCANNDASSGYGIRTLATSNDNYIEIHYTSVTSNQGLFWLAFKVTGNLTVNCPRKDPVNQCLTTTTTPDTTTTTSTTEESTTTTTTEATTSTTTEETSTTTTTETTTTTTELTTSTTTETTTTDMMNTTTPEPPPTTPAPPVQKGASTADTGSSNSIIIVIIVITVVVVGVVVHSIVVCIIHYKQKKKKPKENQQMHSRDQESDRSTVAPNVNPSPLEPLTDGNSTIGTEDVEQPEDDSKAVRSNGLLPAICSTDVISEGNNGFSDENTADVNSVHGHELAYPDADERTPTPNTDELEAGTEDVFYGRPRPFTSVNENGVDTKPKKKKRRKKKRREDTIQDVNQDTEQQPNVSDHTKNVHISPTLTYRHENEDQTNGNKEKKKKKKKHRGDAIYQDDIHGGEPQLNGSEPQLQESDNESLKKKKRKKKKKRIINPDNQVEPENAPAAANVIGYDDNAPFPNPVDSQAIADEQQNEKRKKKRKKKSRRHTQQSNQVENLSDGGNAQSTCQEESQSMNDQY